MKKKGKFISIQTKIYRILFLMITAGTILCSCGTFGVLYKSILEKSKMDYQMLVNNVMFSLNSNVEDIIRCSELIITNRDVIAYLKNTYDKKQDYFYFLAQADIEREIKNITTMNSDLVDYIMIVDRKKMPVSFDGTLEYPSENEGVLNQSARGFFWQGEELYYSCPFVGEQTDQEIGRLYVAVKETKMFSALAVPDQTSLRVSLTDRDNNYVSGNADGERNGN